MGIEDFDRLLPQLAESFGEWALVRAGQFSAWIKGRFIVDPFDVSQNPADNGLNVTKTVFSYDIRSFYSTVVSGHPGPPGLHTHLIIRGNEYEIVKIDRDDLGEHALSLLLVDASVTRDHQEAGP